MKSISVDELQKILAAEGDDHMLIDVREPFEYKSEAIKGAENIPADSLANAVNQLRGVETVYLHCRTGGRSSRACAELERAGIHVVNVEGGIEAWKESGYSIQSSKKSLPVMQQMMIVAGALVVLGVLLGFFVHPELYLISIGVGLGLMFGGTTGKCGMTKMLKIMPWNK